MIRRIEKSVDIDDIDVYCLSLGIFNLSTMKLNSLTIHSLYTVAIACMLTILRIV